MCKYMGINLNVFLLIHCSERADPSSRPGFRKRLTEGANINRSLVTLGYVIKALGECCIVGTLIIHTLEQLVER